MDNIEKLIILLSSAILLFILINICINVYLSGCNKPIPK